MISVHVIRSENSERYWELLDQSFQFRHEIFVNELGWKDMKPENGRERDQFDTPDTVHLLITEDDTLVGGGRLHSSFGPTLMSEIYPQLADVRGIQRGSDVMEITRGWIVKGRREERPRRVAGAWKAAMLEYGLSEGIRYLTGVAETWFMPRLANLGWAPRYLGLPQDLDGYNLVAFRAEVSASALEATRAYYGFEGPVTVWNGVTPVRPDAMGERTIVRAA